MKNNFWHEKEYRRVFRNLSWPDTPEGREELKRFNPEDFVKQVRAIGGKVITCDAQSQWYAFYDSRFGKKHPSLENRDLLKQMVSECHKAGIKFVAYIPTLIIMNAADEHPDWIQRYADGGTVFIEDNREKPFYALCPNSPFREFRQKQLAEICTYDVDGFFFDGTAFYAGKSGKPACYCQYCRAKYYKEHRREMPVNPGSIGWGKKTGNRAQQSSEWNREWKEFLLWRYRQIEEMMQSFTDVIHAKNKNSVIINNCFAPFTDYFSASSFELIKAMDLPATEVCLGIEGGPTWGRSLWATYLIKILRSLNNDRPVLSFCAADNVVDTLPQTEASIAAGGIPDPYIAKNILSFKPLFNGIKEKEEHLIGASSVKWGGLVISEKSRDFYGREYHLNYLDGVQGFFQVCTESHLNVNMVPLLNDKKKLSEYAFLVLSNTACLSDEDLTNLHAYVKRGGGLIITCQSGFFDQWGCKRDNSGFAEMVGADFTGQTEQTMLKPGVSHEIMEDRVIKDAFRYGSVAYPGTSVLIKTRKECRVICESTFPGSYPFVTVRQYEKGRVIYMAGNIGKIYMSHPNSFLRRLMEKSVEWVANRKDVVSIIGPQTLITNIYQQKNKRKIIIHLLNTSYPKEEKAGTPYDYSEIIPLYNIKVVLNGKLPREAYLFPDKIPLKFKDSVIMVEEVKRYNLLVLQY